MSVIVGGVFNSGILADSRPGARLNYAPAGEDALARAQAIQATLVGARSAAEVEVPDELWTALAGVGPR